MSRLNAKHATGTWTFDLFLQGSLLNKRGGWRKDKGKAKSTPLVSFASRSKHLFFHPIMTMDQEKREKQERDDKRGEREASHLWKDGVG